MGTLDLIDVMYKQSPGSTLDIQTWKNVKFFQSGDFRIFSESRGFSVSQGKLDLKKVCSMSKNSYFQTEISWRLIPHWKMLRGKHKIRVATCQGNVRGKQNFLQVGEKLGILKKMSRNFCHLAHVREFCDVMSGNCQGIFFWTFLDWNFHHMIRALSGLYVNVCLANINSRSTDYYC